MIALAFARLREPKVFLGYARNVKFNILQKELLSLGNLSATRASLFIWPFSLVRKDPSHCSKAC